MTKNSNDSENKYTDEEKSFRDIAFNHKIVMMFIIIIPLSILIIHLGWIINPIILYILDNDYDGLKEFWENTKENILIPIKYSLPSGFFVGTAAIFIKEIRAKIKYTFFICFTVLTVMDTIGVFINHTSTALYMLYILSNLIGSLLTSLLISFLSEIVDENLS